MTAKNWNKVLRNSARITLQENTREEILSFKLSAVEITAGPAGLMARKADASDRIIGFWSKRSGLVYVFPISFNAANVPNPSCGCASYFEFAFPESRLSFKRLPDKEQPE